ncbi:hypothetical protein [Sphingosinithalassobacter portus]|uniref:hypothetical protein n=1 Tax=Stakelama portus TaxID=2676234 RepID=UPI00196211AA|nr:hypothetical protein [Sphingosinithalassobacter portus]
MMRDIANHLNVARVISPAAAVTDNTAVVGQIVDHNGYESACYFLNAGAIADADATLTVLLEHGDEADLSDAAAVPDEQLTGTEALAGLTFADDNALRKLGYVGSKQYTRLTVTPANNTGNIFLSALCVLGDPRFAPTPNPPA